MKNNSYSQSSRGIEILEARIAPATLIGLNNTNQLITFDSASPGTISATIAITGLGAGETVVGIDFRAATGELYGLTIDGSNAGKLYAIDATTGAASGSVALAADPADATSPFTALSGTNFGLDFNPVADRLRVVSDTEQNLRINVDTGLVTTDLVISTNSTLAGAAYTNSFAGASSTQLFDIDVAGDRLVLQSPPNDGTITTVGVGLGVDANGVSGFDIVSTRAANGTVTDSAFAALTVAGSTGLYSINLTTGTAALVGTVGTGAPLSGLTSATGAPSANAFTIDATTNHLLRFNTDTPNVTTDLGAITGLGVGESIIGFDFRASSGELIVVTKNASNAGRLFTLDTATAVATPTATLTADGTDTSSPFTALSGTNFGVDFNPQTDRLRIVSDSGQNLRINVSTGRTITDTNLNGASTSVFASAQTNAFSGATSTTLFDLNFATDQLFVQDANTGTLTLVGNLGVDASGVGGFDIRADNEAFATLTVGGVTSLFSINLSTGAATVVGAVGTGTSGSLGFAIAPAGTIQVSAANVQVGEGAGNAAITVNRVGGSDGTVSVLFRTSNGTALAGSDYTAVNRVITFGPGVTSQVVNVPITDDLLDENAETFLVTLTDPTGAAAINDAQDVATVTILDNDGAAPTVSITDVTQTEGEFGTTNFVFTVSLSDPSASNTTVNFATANGTATAGSDYVATNGTLTILAGQSSGTISVPVNGDTSAEPDENFSVTLSNLSSGVLGDATGIGTILNDDINIVNAKQVSFTDVDGDIVTVRVTQGSLDSSNFVLTPSGTAGGQQSLTLNLDDAEFANASVFITARRTSGGGDGLVNVGFIDATSINLGNVSVDGDLGQIDAAGVKKLTVHSLGLLGTSTQEVGGDLESNISGNLGKLSILTDLRGTLIVDGNIGSVKIGGDIQGGDDDHSGSLEAGGRITKINLNGDLIGGEGTLSGSIIARSAGPVKIRGDIQGGSILLAGNSSPSNSRASLALTSLLVSGNLEHGDILVGYDRDGLPVNADVSTGAIRIAGFAEASIIAVGVEAGADGMFGTSDDSLIAAPNGIVARIASLSIGSQIFGTPDDLTDSFAFAAEQIAIVQVGKAKLAFNSNTTDDFAVGTTGDVRIKEIGTFVV